MRILWVLCVAMLMCPGVSAADLKTETPVESAAPAPLVLDELIEAAVQNHPEIIAARAEWMAAKQRVWADTSLPDPEIEISPGTNESRFSAMQAVPFLGKLVLKGKMASKDAEAAYLRFMIMERDIRLKVAETYYDLYYLDASIQTIEETKALLKRFESVALNRYSSRTGSQRDVAKMQAEVSLSYERLYRLEQQRHTAAAILNTLLNRDPLTPVGKAVLPSKPEFELSLIEAVNLAVENRQEIAEAEAMVKKSGYAKRLAQLSYLPDLAIGVEYEKPKMEESEDNLMIPIKFNVPLWQNRLIPEILESRHLEEAARAKLTAVKNTAFQEVKDSYYRYETAKKISDLYEAAIIPQAEIAFNADLAGYESGQTDFLNLLDSERVYLNAKLSHVEFFTESLKAYVDLLRCCGLDFDFVHEQKRLQTRAEGDPS